MPLLDVCRLLQIDAFLFHTEQNTDHQSVSQNPYYFRGFFGLTIPPGTHAFIFRMFANKSAAYPEGFLDRATLKSFYAMTGPDDKLVYSPGFERIPENWYTRAEGDPYDTFFFDRDFSTLVKEHPELVAFGGNTGTVNSFAGLDVGNLTVSLHHSCIVHMKKSDKDENREACTTAGLCCRVTTSCVSSTNPSQSPRPI